jgi:hypothetical protein
MSTRRPAARADRLAPAPTSSVGLVAARLARVDGEVATLTIDGREVDAAIDASVDTAILSTALKRGERVIATREGDGWVVLGTLRTAATPGVDEGDFVIRAGRLRVVVDHAFEVLGGPASLVVKATGRVETIAEEITARASGVQRLVARMLRLN